MEDIKTKLLITITDKNKNRKIINLYKIIEILIFLDKNKMN